MQNNSLFWNQNCMIIDNRKKQRVFSVSVLQSAIIRNEQILTSNCFRKLPDAFRSQKMRTFK